MCCPAEDINPTNGLMAIVCLILNVFLPGVGTIVNACLGVRVAPGVMYGILQMLTTPLLVGWVWAIIYGIKIVQLSGEKVGPGYQAHYVETSIA